MWKIDMNKFKPIWGLMLGILLLEVDRPWVAGLYLWRFINMKPTMILKMVVHEARAQGPRAT